MKTWESEKESEVNKVKNTESPRFTFPGISQVKEEKG